MTETQQGNSTVESETLTCPSCGKKGKSVKRITLESLLTDEAKARTGDLDGYRFCPTPNCKVAYYRPAGASSFGVDDVRVPIGQKQTESSRKVCYCFDHTAADIESDVAATGTSAIPDDIAAMCKQGLDRCPETNPQGSCCLGNVKTALKDAQAKHGVSEGQQEPGAVAASCCDTNVASKSADADGHDCCSQPAADGPTKHAPAKAGLMASGGAVVAAVLSSACCWLPLLLIAFGASAAGVAGFFEAYRPIFLGATGVLLAGAFYLVYRKPRCAPGEACAVPNTRLQRFNRGMLWVATVIVAVFATFPNYVGALIGGGSSGNGTQVASTALPDRVFRIEGMTCEGCAANLESQLAHVPGIATATVSYQEKTANIVFKTGSDLHPTDERLLAVIGNAGFKGVPVVADRTIQVSISGMTCEGCAAGLVARLKETPGVKGAAVDYKAKRASVVLSEHGTPESVLDAIATEGFEGTLQR